MQIKDLDGQVMLFDPDLPCGKTCLGHIPAESRPARTSRQSSSRSSRLKNHRFMLLDLRPGAGNMLGPYWEYDPAWLGSPGQLNFSECPKDVVDASLSAILVATVPSKYYLSRTACRGILRRAEERGKPLPPQLEAALKLQAGIVRPPPDMPVSELLRSMAEEETVAGLLMAFAANQRDEVRDLHDIARALGAQPGMKQQTFVANCLNPWDTQQSRVFTPDSIAPTLASADGGGGRNPGGLILNTSGITAKGNGDCFLSLERHTALSTGGGLPGQGYPCVLTAGFCMESSAAARSIGYQEEVSPTLKAGGPKAAVLCINDQGGSIMSCSEDIAGTLRAQEHGHQPLIYENHGVDARYKGPLSVAPTMSARYGTGGLNTPLVSTFAQQRVDCYQEDTIASTESARQHKSATDLILQPDGSGNEPVCQLIRKLLPLEAERLQGYPDGWTDLPGASDSARFKALGNSVAIPCVEYLMQGIALVLRAGL